MYHILSTELSTVLTIVLLPTVLYTRLYLTSDPSLCLDNPLLASRYSVPGTFVPALPFSITTYKPIYPPFSPSVYPPFFIPGYFSRLPPRHVCLDIPLLPSRYSVSENYVPVPPSSFTVTYRLLWMHCTLRLLAPYFTILLSHYTSFTVAQRCSPLNLWLSYAHHSLTHPPCYEILVSIFWCRHSLPYTHLVLSSRSPLSVSIRHTQSNPLHHNTVQYYRYSNHNNCPLR